MTAIPEGWIYVVDFGIRQMTADLRTISANVALGQDTLAAPDGLAEYVKKQVEMITGHLAEAKTAGPQTTASGAEEAYLLFVRHRPTGAPDMLHAQTYARVGLLGRDCYVDHCRGAAQSRAPGL